MTDLITVYRGSVSPILLKFSDNLAGMDEAKVACRLSLDANPQVTFDNAVITRDGNNLSIAVSQTVADAWTLGTYIVQAGLRWGTDWEVSTPFLMEVRDPIVSLS